MGLFLNFILKHYNRHGLLILHLKTKHLPFSYKSVSLKEWNYLLSRSEKGEERTEVLKNWKE